MIEIKTFATPKTSGSGSTTTSSTSVTNNTIVNAESDKWFFFNSDTNSVGCKYDFYSVGAVSANGADTEGSNILHVYDGLDSYDTTYALSANQGRVLKSLIDNAQISGGGTVSTVDWSDVTNKPSTFTPSSHTHSMNDVTNLNSQLSFYSSSIAATGQALETHVDNSNVHLTAAQQTLLSNLSAIDLTKLNALLSLMTVNGQNVTFVGNIYSQNDITAQV